MGAIISIALTVSFMITSAFVLKLDLSTQINIRSNLTDVEVSAKVSGVAESRYLSYWQCSVDEIPQRSGMVFYGGPRAKNYEDTFSGFTHFQ